MAIFNNRGKEYKKVFDKLYAKLQKYKFEELYPHLLKIKK